MPYEIFDPASACDPLLPLNTISNKLTFFRINVFDAKIDELVHQKNGKLDSYFDPKQSSIRNYRLGIPLTDLFPEIRKRLKTKFIKGVFPKPVKLGIEGTFLPSSKGYPTGPTVTNINVFEADLNKKTFNIGKLKIRVEEFSEELKSGGEVYYKQGSKLFCLKKAPSQVYTGINNIGKTGLVNTGIGSVKLNKNLLNELILKGKIKVNVKGSDILIKHTGKDNSVPAPSVLFMEGVNLDFSKIDPSELNDEDYYLWLGMILTDPRSDNSEYGIGMDGFSPEGFSDEEYARILGAFSRDDRYGEYFKKYFPPLALKSGGGRLPSYEIGLYTSYEQNWELLGYSRGTLLESITLAPKEEVSIEVFTFDRIKIEQEKELTTEFEKNLEITTFARASAEISRDLTTTTDVNADIGLGIPLPIEGVPVDLDVSGGVSNQVKEGIQTSLNQVNEVTVNASEKFKSKTRVKIVQTRETGEETRTIRKIVNPNGSRTLTLNYFELLETYRVTTYLKDTKKFCLLVDNPDLGAVDINFVMAFEDRLQKSLLSPNYLPGFEAAKNLAAQRWFERKSEIKNEIENTNKQNGGADTTEPQTPEKPIITIGKNLRNKLDKFLEADLMKAAGVLSKHYDPFLAKDKKPSKKKVSNAEDTLGLFNFWLKFKIAYPGVESKAIEYVEATGGSPGENDFVEQLGLFLTGMDDEWLTSIKMIAINLVSIQLASLLSIPFPLLVPLFYELALIDNNNGLPALIEKAKKELKNYELANSAALPSAASASGTPADIPQQPPPPQVFTLNELASANAEFEKLVLHIEANKTYYINKILLFEDSNQRYERLKLKGVSNFVENRIIGFVGNKTVYPLKLDTLEESTRSRLVNELANFRPDRDETLNGESSPKITPPPAETFSLPTSGVYVESMLGKCDSLEKYLLDRRIIEQQAAQAQADMASVKVQQQKEENNRLAERIKQGILDNPFKN